MTTDASYDYSILLTKAYRTLRSEVYVALEKYELIPTHWSLIGIVYHAQTGVTLSDAAIVLGVKLPLVTIMVDYLASKGLIERIANKADGRSKLLVPTIKGMSQVATIEKEIIENLAPLMHGVSTKDMVAFQSVLRSIIDNDPTTKSRK